MTDSVTLFLRQPRAAPNPYLQGTNTLAYFASQRNKFYNNDLKSRANFSSFQNANQIDSYIIIKIKKYYKIIPLKDRKSDLKVVKIMEQSFFKVCL